MPDATTPPQQWPGQRLGLPETGPRSIGRLGRRLAAIAIDWAIVAGISAIFFGYTTLSLLLLFLALQIVPLVLVNATIGHAIVGLRLQRIEGGRLGIWPPIVRSALLALVVPAFIVDADQRGLHDRAVRTILLRR
ncbi:RDD family protein [Microcella alkalica]|uniref:RDD family protein n=1 Tax=Microcella alkalica TaxID=355930 RepID=UPI00145E2864|nr:RDD family protein [Microcella alkalica]